jgi:glyoxylase-like metal-dependent hydrolase (beta-lactamase superfamily II)
MNKTVKEVMDWDSPIVALLWKRMLGVSGWKANLGQAPVSSSAFRFHWRLKCLRKLNHYCRPGEFMQQIKDGIFYEDSYLGVTLGALVYTYGTILIDAPLRPEDARSWRSALLNQRGGINRLLVSLDSHTDRTLGARVLDCAILAHQKSAQAFRNRPVVFKGETIETGADWETYIDSIGTRWALPDLTFSRRMTLHWGGPEVVVEHHPGPAPGASWVIVPEDKVVFVGDAVLIKQPPFLANADLVSWLEALDLLLGSYRNFTIVSGRGGPVSTAVVQTQQRILKNLEKGLDKLAKRNAAPESTEKLIPSVLETLSISKDKQEQYAKRMRHGLYQYYLRHFRALNSSELQIEEESYHQL